MQTLEEREREGEKDRETEDVGAFSESVPTLLDGAETGFNVCVCGDDDSAVVLAFAFAAFLISFKIEITKDRIYKHPVTRGLSSKHTCTLLSFVVKFELLLSFEKNENKQK